MKLHNEILGKLKLERMSLIKRGRECAFLIEGENRVTNFEV